MAGLQVKFLWLHDSQTGDLWIGYIYLQYTVAAMNEWDLMCP